MHLITPLEEHQAEPRLRSSLDGSKPPGAAANGPQRPLPLGRPRPLPPPGAAGVGAGSSPRPAREPGEPRTQPLVLPPPPVRWKSPGALLLLLLLLLAASRRRPGPVQNAGHVRAG